MGTGLENMPVEKATIILIERFDSFMKIWHEREEAWQKSRTEHRLEHEKLDEEQCKIKLFLFGNGDVGLGEKVRINSKEIESIKKSKWSRQDWLTVIGLLVGSGVLNLIIVHFIK